VLENEPAVGISVTDGRVVGVETAGRSIAARAVVDAAGGWVRQVAELAGARVPVAAVRHQLLITAPVPEVDPADPIARVVDAAVYLRPARGGLMLGGFEAGPLPLDPGQQPDSFSTDDVPLDLGVLRAMAGQVGAEVPVASAPVAEHRGGLFTMSPDGRFVAGPVPEVPGLWAASGCNGSGFSSSPALGEALAAWITTGDAPPGMTALAPGRFGPLPDDELVTRGLWQYAHYYDPMSSDLRLCCPKRLSGRLRSVRLNGDIEAQQAINGDDAWTVVIEISFEKLLVVEQVFDITGLVGRIAASPCPRWPFCTYTGSGFLICIAAKVVEPALMTARASWHAYLFGKNPQNLVKDTRELRVCLTGSISEDSGITFAPSDKPHPLHDAHGFSVD
jgi:hypothetical protein